MIGHDWEGFIEQAHKLTEDELNRCAKLLKIQANYLDRLSEEKAGKKIEGVPNLECMLNG